VTAASLSPVRVPDGVALYVDPISGDVMGWESFGAELRVTNLSRVAS